MKKLLSIVFVICMLLCAVAIATPQMPVAFASDDIFDFCQDVGDLFVATGKGEQLEQVYLGGYPLGFTIDGDGVTVVGLNEFVRENGQLCCPALACGLQPNDVILQLDGVSVYSSQTLIDVAKKSQGKQLELKFSRGGVEKNCKIIPQKDLLTGNYRLGIWTKDASSGIGTLTFVKKDLSFASLGHPICDGEGKIVNCSKGSVFDCEIQDIKRGQIGKAGELKGNFHFDCKLGILRKNNKFGAYGKFDALPHFCSKLVDVADVSQVKPGKAQIVCALDGKHAKCYDIKIVKANYQTSCDDKGMVILVTDAELLQKTGGIVQGMSGSPILQNGKLVGAVTHVFVNDPTRGYGIYAKWMLQN